ncbi:MAG TPA: hypothetical protein P5077_08170 [bacterium]|nr:hypothetical protein [bacterium]
MIDLHSHLLHQLDDGPESVEESRECLRILAEFGFDEIIPTPHRFHMLYSATPEDTADRMAEIGSLLVRRFSFEYMYGNDLLESSGDLFELATTPSGWKVLLVEFLPLMSRKSDIEQAIFSLNLKGIAPLIAHIERYTMPDEVWEELKKRYSLYYQISLKTLSHGFFDNKRAQILRLLDAGLIDNAATDLHRLAKLRQIEQGLDLLRRKYPEQVERLFSLSFED